MALYKLTQGVHTFDCIIREDGLVIPPNVDNIDYQQYLRWLQKGNTPDAADPEPVIVEQITRVQILNSLTHNELQATYNSLNDPANWQEKMFWDASVSIPVNDSRIVSFLTELFGEFRANQILGV